MDNKALIRLGVLIVVVVIGYFVKKERDKKQAKIDSIIKKYSNKKKAKLITKVTPEFKEQQIEYLKDLINLLINEEKSNEIIQVINAKIKANDYYENWAITNELLSREVQNHNWNHNICLYGYFDWKQPSEDLNHFIVNSLKYNFGIEKSFDSIHDLDENRTIPDAFPIYENELEKFNLKLRNIDIGGDCYTIIIVKNENLNEVEEIIENIGLKIEVVRPSNWGRLNDI
ncbi:MAG: hypothetical protein HKP48_00680 [Winogradskyella sp.]|uniref:DUF6630 family protein n=1 Tax=Winogradskyella sp. TaxID=1883156 RepID=UPI0017DD0706|nr:hypothetical protein [Winogradskyella sp.]MBT8244873.1 hypothetical protein [Winogradskyella sp.]NNK21831.1 hypothetical protein [Winogradskyella sp.]